MKKRLKSPIYFVIAVYAWLAGIGYLELRCEANDTANQSYLLVLNKAENTLAIIDPQLYTANITSNTVTAFDFTAPPSQQYAAVGQSGEWRQTKKCRRKK